MSLFYAAGSGLDSTNNNTACKYKDDGVYDKDGTLAWGEIFFLNETLILQFCQIQGINVSQKISSIIQRFTNTLIQP